MGQNLALNRRWQGKQLGSVWQQHPQPTMALPMMPMPRKPILVAPGAAVGTAAAEAAQTRAQQRRRCSWAAPCGRCAGSLRFAITWHGLKGTGEAAKALLQACEGRTACETGDAARAACMVNVEDQQVPGKAPMARLA